MKHSRFTCPSKKPKVKNSLTVIILSSTIEYRKKTFGVKSFYVEKNENKSILEKQIESIQSTFKEFETILCLGQDLEKLQSKVPENIRIVENTNYEQTSTTEDVRLCLNNSTTSHVLIIDGGVVFGKKFPKFNLNNSAIITSQNLHDKIIGVNICQDIITNFNFTLKNKWSHVLYLTGKELQLMKKVCKKENQHLLLFESLNQVIEMGGELHNIEDTEIRLI